MGVRGGVGDGVRGGDVAQWYSDWLMYRRGPIELFRVSVGVAQLV